MCAPLAYVGFCWHLLACVGLCWLSWASVSQCWLSWACVAVVGMGWPALAGIGWCGPVLSGNGGGAGGDTTRPGSLLLVGICVVLAVTWQGPGQRRW